MGKRGPPRVPLAILRARGSWLAAARERQSPQGTIESPACPEILTAEERVVWRETVPLLLELGVLTPAERDALTIYCQCWVRYQRLLVRLSAQGETYQVRSPEGEVLRVSAYPEVGIARHLATVLLRYQQEFGMTPASRSGVSAAGPAKAADKREATIGRIVG